MRQRRLQLMQSLFDEYIEMYAARDDKLTARFSDTFSGYAGSSDILVTSKDEWVKITRQDFAQVPERIHIEVLDLSLQDLAEDIVRIVGAHEASPIMRSTSPWPANIARTCCPGLTG